MEDFLARIFWDTNLFIYLLEDHPVFAPQVENLRHRMLARGDQLYTSALTVGEILVKPALAGHREAMDRYLAFFRQPATTVVAFDLKAAPLYAHIRQDRTVRRSDAIQLACAAAVETDLFVTNDVRLSRKVVAGISFITSLEQAPL